MVHLAHPLDQPLLIIYTFWLNRWGLLQPHVLFKPKLINYSNWQKNDEGDIVASAIQEHCYHTVKDVAQNENHTTLARVKGKEDVNINMNKNLMLTISRQLKTLKFWQM
jgi:hypothetical protein